MIICLNLANLSYEEAIKSWLNITYIEILKTTCLYFSLKRYDCYLIIVSTNNEGSGCGSDNEVGHCAALRVWLVSLNVIKDQNRQTAHIAAFIKLLTPGPSHDLKDD